MIIYYYLLIYQKTNHLYISIEGAGLNKSINIPCILKTHGKTWDIWSPSDNNSFLKVATPWTIKILNWQEKLLDMGSDDINVISCDKLQKGTFVVKVNNCINIDKGDNLLNTDNEIYKVLNIIDDKIEIENNILINTQLCNIKKQFFIFFSYIINIDN